MMTKTAKALAAYDRLGHDSDDDKKLEELRRGVAIAFSKESPNSEDRCLELIYPGPAVPRPGSELSFVRQMVEMSKTSDMKWNPRLVQFARVRGYKDPGKLLKEDSKTMMKFHFWIEEKWQQWYTSIGVGKLPLERQRYYQDQKAFDTWLSKVKS
jgi:hypothetical protein